MFGCIDTIDTSREGCSFKKYTNYRLAKVFKDGYWNKELYVCKFDIYYRFLFISASLIRNRCLNFQF